MNKKMIIGIVVAIIIVITGIVTAVFIINQPKNDPAETWQKYIACINNKNYEEMYNMLTDTSKNTISQEDFIARNKNIYEGIKMENMQISNLRIAESEENSNISEISYYSTMDTEAGKVEFDNTVRLTEDKEKGYLVNWSSSLIFPQLGNEDKVRISTIEAQRGEIIDKNGKTLAGKGTVSSVGIVSGKLGENREQSIEQIANLLGISTDSINKTLSSSWVKEDTFVPIKKVLSTETALKEQLLQIPGIKITSVSSRVYPLGEAAAQLVGYVQNITAEELKENADKGYDSNSVIGKAGLEKAYEDRLKGKDGVEIYIEDAEGNRKTEIAKIDVQNGETIKLTIDADMQT